MLWIPLPLPLYTLDTYEFHHYLRTPLSQSPIYAPHLVSLALPPLVFVPRAETLGYLGYSFSQKFQHHLLQQSENFRTRLYSIIIALVVNYKSMYLEKVKSFTYELYIYLKLSIIFQQFSCRSRQTSRHSLATIAMLWSAW